MKVFLTGATGAIGRPTVPLLVSAGYDVTAVVRSPEKRAVAEAAGATGLEVDLFDGAAVTEAVAGHEVVINLVTHIPSLVSAMRPKAWVTNDRLRHEASAHLVDAALATGAQRFVQESITFTYADSGDRWIDAASAETAPVAITAAALDAEAQAARFTAAGDGHVGVVLRFGQFYGPGLAHTETFLRFARWGIAMAAGDPDGYVSSIQIEDAAAAVVAALGAPAGVYDVVDDEPLTRRAFAAALANAAGRSRHVVLPGKLARYAGPQAEAVRRSQRVGNRRFKEATGWSPRWHDAAEGLAALAAG